MEAGPVGDSLIRAVSDRLPAILTEVTNLLGPEHPDYASFLAREFDQVLRAARGFVIGLLERAVAERAAFVSGAPGVPPVGPGQLLFEEIGRAHCQQGQDLTGLLAACRMGATVAWRHIVDEALRRAVPTEWLAALATTLFAALDHLSSAALRGYLRQEATRARHHDQTRDRLVQLLLSDRCDSAAVAAAAEAAAWALPARAALVLLPVGDRPTGRPLPLGLGTDCLWSRRTDATIAVIRDPEGPGQRARLATALGGSAGVVGEAVDLARLPESLPRARLALTLRKHGVLDDDPLFVDQHLDTLIVHHNPAALELLRRRVLAPLVGLPKPARQRLEQTLRSWLTNLGSRQAVASELHVHPQTVRYRLAQLRELFGQHLDDPHERAAMILALAWGDPLPERADPARMSRVPDAG
jgi:PucR-like helix-turn-helix protein